MIYKEQFKIQLEDIGKTPYLTNKAVLRYFENIATYQSDSIGEGMKAVEEKGEAWIVLDWRVKVLNRIKYGENIKVKTWCSKIQKFFAFRDFQILNDKDEVCIVGTSRWILRNAKDGKMILLTEEKCKDYGVESQFVLPEEKFLKLAPPKEYSNEISYTTMRRDIDFNMHMHNLNHFDLAYEALPEEIYNNTVFNNFRITYKKEIKLGEEVRCRYSCENNIHTICLIDNEEKVNSIIQLW